MDGQFSALCTSCGGLVEMQYHMRYSAEVFSLLSSYLKLHVFFLDLKGVDGLNEMKWW
jgi:hypothetical protein